MYKLNISRTIQKMNSETLPLKTIINKLDLMKKAVIIQ